MPSNEYSMTRNANRGTFAYIGTISGPGPAGRRHPKGKT